MIVALFDSDGTLYSNQMGWGMMKYEEMHGRPGRARLYYASLMPGYFLNKLGLIKPEAFQHTLIAGLTNFFKGLNLKDGASLFNWVVNEYLLPAKRADVVNRLKEHQAQGHLVIITSGSFTPCLDIIGKHFGVPDLIGTEVEVQNERYTGKIIPPLITGIAKAEKIRELLSTRSVDVDWSSSYAYGDSFTDRNMLELVGHPVAVYPDKKLHKLAKEKNWEILGTPKE
ncbi:MAG: HAD-IB family hydrolase [Anaerolineae bacterium]|nr:HAD-IB family hydrolase [Anaerolineae bacterium]MCI0610435.1 HAD-IB family hydrolase [Anaerolineae bacterium]